MTEWLTSRSLLDIVMIVGMVIGIGFSIPALARDQRSREDADNVLALLKVASIFAIPIAIGLALIYALVRFIKWAWQG
jgi:hypothetical protein